MFFSFFRNTETDGGSRQAAVVCSGWSPALCSGKAGCYSEYLNKAGRDEDKNSWFCVYEKAWLCVYELRKGRRSMAQLEKAGIISGWHRVFWLWQYILHSGQSAQLQEVELCLPVRPSIHLSIPKLLSPSCFSILLQSWMVLLTANSLIV